ncbi:MAG: MBL fold hydrolase [Chlamydiales bacterium 38-26]|nr:MBL fold metallo-hydrolase [Chlamydiales bacterium]OJV11409.1 MAG: MBL fold hydrolase [Chlamydiales bacterium 38-26]
MNIQAFPSGPFETNAYVVSCPDTKEAAIIDPAPNSAESIVNYINKHHLTPKKILLTHTHWDHIGDVYPLKEKYHIPVYVHEYDVFNLENPGSDGLPCWISIEGVVPDYLLKEGDRVSIGNQIFEVIETPGHTPGGVCFYNGNQHLLFSGDTLFKGTIGNLSFPTSRPHLMWTSLSKLAKLPAETRVFPGHGLETTIGQEKWLERAEELFGE